MDEHHAGAKSLVIPYLGDRDKLVESLRVTVEVISAVVVELVRGVSDDGRYQVHDTWQFS